jgi:hypothetical protein
MWLDYVSTHPLVQAVLMSFTGVIICVALIVWERIHTKAIELDITRTRLKIAETDQNRKLAQILYRQAHPRQPRGPRKAPAKRARAQ